MTETNTSIDLAYDIAVASYETAVKRLDSVDSRIQTLIAFVVSASAVVFSGTAGRVQFRSTLFALAILSLLGSVGLALYARWNGDTWLLKPNVLRERWLHKSETQFKTDMIYWAGCDFIDNMNLVDRKWRLSLYALILFALEVVFLAVWVAASHP
jgi:hypothetical protein